MSFSKTISVCAALASIFAAGATGYKLAQDNQEPNVYEKRIQELEEQLKQPQQEQQLQIPQPVSLPREQPQVQQIPQELQLPPPTTPPVTNETLWLRNLWRLWLGGILSSSHIPQICSVRYYSPVWWLCVWWFIASNSVEYRFKSFVWVFYTIQTISIWL